MGIRSIFNVGIVDALEYRARRLHLNYVHEIYTKDELDSMENEADSRLYNFTQRLREDKSVARDVFKNILETVYHDGFQKSERGYKDIIAMIDRAMQESREAIAPYDNAKENDALENLAVYADVFIKRWYKGQMEDTQAFLDIYARRFKLGKAFVEEVQTIAPVEDYSPADTGFHPNA